jgi:hypothetical protein
LERHFVGFRKNISAVEAFQRQEVPPILEASVFAFRARRRLQRFCEDAIA